MEMEYDIVKGRGTLAQLFKVSTNAIANMELRGMPILKKGKGSADPNIYALQEVIAWRFADSQKSALNSEDREQLALRRANAETKKAEIEVAKLEGSLVDVAMVRQGLENVAVNFRTMAMGVPAQIGREIDEPHIRVRVVEIVDRRIREMLELMASYNPTIEPHDDDHVDQDDEAVDPPVTGQKRGKPRRLKKVKQEAACR